MKRIILGLMVAMASLPMMGQGLFSVTEKSGVINTPDSVVKATPVVKEGSKCGGHQQEGCAKTEQNCTKQEGCQKEANANDNCCNAAERTIIKCQDYGNQKVVTCQENGCQKVVICKEDGTEEVVACQKVAGAAGSACTCKEGTCKEGGCANNCNSAQTVTVTTVTSEPVVVESQPVVTTRTVELAPARKVVRKTERKHVGSGGNFEKN